jgi:hypothetical protein
VHCVINPLKLHLTLLYAYSGYNHDTCSQSGSAYVYALESKLLAMASARNATATTTSSTATAAATKSTAKARSSRSSSTAASSRRKAAALQGLHSDGTRQRAASVGPTESCRRDAPSAQLQSVEAGLVRTAAAVVTSRSSSSGSGVHSDSVVKSNVLSTLPTTSSVACSSNSSTGSNHNVVGIAGISSKHVHKPIAAAENIIELRRYEGGAGSYEHKTHGEVSTLTSFCWYSDAALASIVHLLMLYAMYVQPHFVTAGIASTDM